jgi:hypothetical protein
MLFNIMELHYRFVLNSNGTITVPSWTGFRYLYGFYQICEKINPSNCDIANAKPY